MGEICPGVARNGLKLGLAIKLLAGLGMKTTLIVHTRSFLLTDEIILKMKMIYE